MKPPGWMVIERQHVEGNCLVVDVRIRYWHPGFWWALITGRTRWVAQSPEES